ncbi:MAG: hypothetical protein PHS92_02970 [Candidatus Gracilibacteria bacterium]|nr:hypothetical protein [Candidatus Gracilibacteria bacterium]
MRNRNLCMLGVGYLAGILIATKFIKKDKKKKFDSKFEELKSDIVQVHKDLFNYLNDNLSTEENKKILNEYKEKISKEVESFRLEAEKFIEELKDKGITKKDDIEKELSAVYEKRMDYIENIKKQAGDLYHEVKDIIMEVVDESKGKIEETYKDTKKKIKK